MKRTAIIVALAAIVGSLVVPTLLAQPLAQITSPRDQAQVRGLVPVEGSSNHPQFQKYEIHFGPQPNPNDQWTPIGGSPFTAPVVQGRLGLWDTTIIPDGVYSLRLRVVRADGNYDEYYVRGIQVSNTRPTDTPVPEPGTPTPSLPPAPTQTPAPTPTIVIGVPTVASPTPRPTSTPLPTQPPTATSEPANLPFSSLSDALCWGAGATLAAFAAIGVLFVLKGALASAIRWLARRGREGLGIYRD